MIQTHILPHPPLFYLTNKVTNQLKESDGTSWKSKEETHTMMDKKELEEYLRGIVLNLPEKPGCYQYLDETGTIIYVGKAKKLRNRVSQYFQDTASHTEKTRVMVAQVDHFDTIFVKSEFEALVLENSLIKRHMPRYNILLKDDKG